MDRKAEELADGKQAVELTARFVGCSMRDGRWSVIRQRI